MLTEIKIEDLAKQLEGLLQIKYSRSYFAPILKKFLGKKDRKVIVMQIDDFEPLVIELSRDSYKVWCGAAPKSNVRVTIPMKDMMGIFMGKLPFKSFVKGKVRFSGSPADGLMMQKLFHVTVGDPRSAFEYISHYYLDD